MRGKDEITNAGAKLRLSPSNAVTTQQTRETGSLSPPHCTKYNGTALLLSGSRHALRPVRKLGLEDASLRPGSP